MNIVAVVEFNHTHLILSVYVASFTITFQQHILSKYLLACLLYTLLHKMRSIHQYYRPHITVMFT